MEKLYGFLVGAGFGFMICLVLFLTLSFISWDFSILEHLLFMRMCVVVVILCGITSTLLSLD